MIPPLNRAGIPTAEIERIPIDDPRWRQHDEYTCVQCGTPALANPFTNAIMGCFKCGFTTTRITEHFARVPQRSQHAMA